MKKIFIRLIYFAFTIPIYYIWSAGITFGGINFLYCYLIAIFFALYTFFAFLIKPDMDRMIKIVKWVCIFIMPYVISILVSALLWVFNFTSIRVMLRGFSWPCYQIIAVLVGASSVYFFGKKGVYYQMTAILAAYLIFFIEIAAQNGIATFFNDYLNVILSYGYETGSFSQIEYIAFAHGMGLFIIYLLYTIKENTKINLIYFLPVLFCFLSGYKRSAMVGLIITFFVFALGRLFSDEGKKTYCAVVGTVMIAAGFIYVAILDSDLFDRVVEMFDLNTMGRQNMYDVMRNYYEFNIAYIGKGLGYVAYNISAGIIKIGNYNMGDIHNEFLRMYIELGMIAYVVWLWSFFKFRVDSLIRLIDAKTGLFMLSCMGYCWGCFLTENMYYRFNTTIALAVIVFSYCMQREEEKEKQLNEREIYV